MHSKDSQACPSRIIIDNCKCAITKACFYEPQVQRSYAECAEGYGFKIDACPPDRMLVDAPGPGSRPPWQHFDFVVIRERAALNWAELLTRRAVDHSDNDAAFSALKSLFSVQEIVDLSWAIAQINAWNQMAVGMRQPPPDQPIE